MVEKIALVVFDGFTDLDLFLPWDLLNRVKTLLAKSDLAVEIASTTPVVTSKCGLEIKTTITLDLLSQMSGVIIGSGPLAQKLAVDQDYLVKLDLDPERQLIAGVCSGALILAGKGWLRGQEATTYPTSRPMLAELGAKVVNRPFVKCGNIATSASCLASIEVVDWMVSELVDQTTADQVIASVQPL